MTNTIIAPIVLRGHHTIDDDSIPFTIHANPNATIPDHAFIGLARYRGKTFLMLVDNAEDCRLGLLCQLQDFALRQAAATPENSTIH